MAYLVLPLPSAWPRRFGIELGDYAAVISKGRLAYAVFGDRGPPRKLGEGSLELFRRLGAERLRPDGRVISSGLGPGVVTLVFPGSGSIADRRNQQTLVNAIAVKARRSFVAAGGKDSAQG